MMRKLARLLGAALLCLIAAPAPALWALTVPAPGQRLTLGEAITFTLANHPRRWAAQDEAGAAQQRVGEARSAMLPQVYGVAQYLGATRNGIDGTNYLNPGFLPRHNGAAGQPQSWSLDNNYVGGLGASQYLLDFGRVRGQIIEQTNHADAAEARARLTELDLIFQTSQRYYALLAATELVKVYDEAITQRKEQLHQSQVKAQAGLTSEIDVYTAQAELARSQVHLLDARNDVDKARAALDNAMGLGLEAPDYRLASTFSYGGVSGTIKDYFATALRLRPELRALQDQARAAGARITEYRSDLLPTVNAVAGYSAIGSGLPAVNNYDIGFTITWPIFNGMLTSHQIEEARLQRRAIEHSMADLRQHILLEVKTAFLDWQTSLQRIHQAEVTLNAARVELELAEKRYTAGLGNIIELTDAERFFIQDKAAYVDALYTFAVAKAGLQRATGQSLEGR